MKNGSFVRNSLLCGVIFALFYVQISFAQVRVTAQLTPDEGIQPRLIKDDNGDIHLLYFKKKLNRQGIREGDFFYRQYHQQQGSWSDKVQVSSKAFNHQGSIGRAGFAIDGEGRLHVVWYQTRPNEYFYTRSNPQRTVFETQRSMVVDNIEGVDAGANITARGNTVAILWGAGELSKEAERTVYARISQDGGFSFGKEQRVSDPSLGACACCALATTMDSDNKLTIAYRSAIDGVGRHMQILSNNLKGSDVVDEAQSYRNLGSLQEWELPACPVTTNAFVEDDELNKWLVFETKSQIVQLNLADESSLSIVADPLTKTRQKNPAMAFNSKGERLIVWGEVISFVKGGELNMRFYNSEGQIKSAAELGVIPGTQIPDHSFPAAVALKDDTFLVLY